MRAASLYLPYISPISPYISLYLPYISLYLYPGEISPIGRVSPHDASSTNALEALTLTLTPTPNPYP